MRPSVSVASRSVPPTPGEVAELAIDPARKACPCRFIAMAGIHSERLPVESTEVPDCVSVIVPENGFAMWYHRLPFTGPVVLAIPAAVVRMLCEVRTTWFPLASRKILALNKRSSSASATSPPRIGTVRGKVVVGRVRERSADEVNVVGAVNVILRAFIKLKAALSTPRTNADVALGSSFVQGCGVHIPAPPVQVVKIVTGADPPEIKLALGSAHTNVPGAPVVGKRLMPM